MSQDLFDPNFPPNTPRDDLFRLDETDLLLDDPRDRAVLDAPSLPIILFSAACGLAASVLAFFLAYRVFFLNLPVSAALATLALCFVLGIVGAGLSILTGSRAVISNVVFGCGVILAMLLFFALCTLAGAVAATLVFSFQ